MILTTISLAGAALCYYLGARDPGRLGHGTTKGWLLALLIGLLLAATYYSFSAFGLMVSIDSLFSNF